MQNKNSFSAFIFSSFIYCISCTLVFAQSAALLPNALQVYFDQNGNPLTGGSVAFYYPGTLNFKPIWKDSGEVTPWINPITLDAAGRPPGGSGGVYGQGAYRQIVKDVNGNLQWDAVTSSAGSAGGGVAATGDGDLVGTVKPWAGLTAPNQYQFAYGQQISRTTFAVLFTAITQSLNVVCTSASNTLSGIADTTSINIGSPIEVSACVVPGTTVSSKTTSTVVMSNPSSVNLSTTAVFFPFGNGDGSTTFTLPDFRGNVIAGRPNMGGTASTNLTNAFCANPTAQGAKCGSQSQTLVQSNLPNIVPTFNGTPLAPTGTVTADDNVGIQASQTGGGAAVSTFNTLTPAHSITLALNNYTPGGTISSINGNVTQTAFSNVQPIITLNYIIKVTPDTNSAIATGVTDIAGMTGSIACGTGVSCTGNIISLTGGSIPINSITNSLLAQMPANTTKCNPTGSLANTQDCTATQLASIFPGAVVGSVLTYGAAPAWSANSIGLNGAAGQNFISGEPAYVLELINNNSALQLLRISTYGTAPSGGENNVHWVRMDGSAASPTATKTGMFFLSFGTRGNDGQAGIAGNTGSTAAFQSIACSNWTSSDHCTEFDWATTPLGSTTRTNTMRLANGGLNLSGAVWQGGGYLSDGTAGGITITCGRILGGLLERAAGPVAPFTDTTATAQQIVQCANTQGGGPGNGANVPIHTYFIYSNKSGQSATLAGGTGITIGAAGGGAALTLATGTAAMWEVIIENSTLGAEAVRLYRTN